MKKIFAAVLFLAVIMTTGAAYADSCGMFPATITATPYTSSAGDLMAKLDIEFSDQSKWHTSPDLPNGYASYWDGYELYYTAQLPGVPGLYNATTDAGKDIQWNNYVDGATDAFGSGILSAASHRVPDGALSNSSVKMPMMLAPADLLSGLGDVQFIVSVFLSPIDAAHGWVAGDLQRPQWDGVAGKMTRDYMAPGVVDCLYPSATPYAQILVTLTAGKVTDTMVMP
ncbi:MAG: hypothetical protein M0Z67_04220 [Nitrospiraceae bacterium]|nr:hypothetical protein [Nitrospiraceae bacterium]